MSTRDDPRFTAAVDLLARTGAGQLQIRFCDEEKPPVVWIASAKWGEHWEAAGAMNALWAVFRLLDAVIDGGTCKHCKRPTGFEPSADPMPLDNIVCWYQYDPGAKRFARGCA